MAPRMALNWGKRMSGIKLILNNGANVDVTVSVSDGVVFINVEDYVESNVLEPPMMGDGEVIEGAKPEYFKCLNNETPGPCPFCNSVHVDLFEDVSGFFRVVCRSCCAGTSNGNRDKSIPVKAWNKRVGVKYFDLNMSVIHEEK